MLKMAPHKKVSMLDWTAANARIMAKLLLEVKLAINRTAQYLAYTVKVTSLCHHYMWSSVLLYSMCTHGEGCKFKLLCIIFKEPHPQFQKYK